MSAVLDRVPGQDAAMAFLKGAAERPHHAYVLGGPEGSGKSIAATAFTAALLCTDGRMRDVPRVPPGAGGPSPERLPRSNPRGATSTWTRSARRCGRRPRAPRRSPGRKIFVIREADRLSPGRGRHAAEGPGRAARGRRVPAHVGARSRASRHRPQPLPRGDVHRILGGVRGGRARRRGRTRGAGASGGPPGGRQPRARAAARSER